MTLNSAAAYVLNALSRAADQYGRSMRDVAQGIKDEQDNMAQGYRPHGVSRQALTEVATHHASYTTLLDHANVTLRLSGYSTDEIRELIGRAVDPSNVNEYFSSDDD